MRHTQEFDRVRQTPMKLYSFYFIKAGTPPTPHHSGSCCNMMCRSAHTQTVHALIGCRLAAETLCRSERQERHGSVLQETSSQIDKPTHSELFLSRPCQLWTLCRLAHPAPIAARCVSLAMRSTLPALQSAQRCAQYVTRMRTPGVPGSYQLCLSLALLLLRLVQCPRK